MIAKSSFSTKTPRHWKPNGRSFRISVITLMFCIKCVLYLKLEETYERQIDSIFAVHLIFIVVRTKLNHNKEHMVDAAEEKLNWISLFTQVAWWECWWVLGDELISNSIVDWDKIISFLPKMWIKISGVDDKDCYLNGNPDDVSWQQRIFNLIYNFLFHFLSQIDFFTFLSFTLNVTWEEKNRNLTKI